MKKSEDPYRLLAKDFFLTEKVAYHNPDPLCSGFPRWAIFAGIALPVVYKDTLKFFPGIAFPGLYLLLLLLTLSVAEIRSAPRGNTVRSGNSTRCCDSRRTWENDATAIFLWEGIPGER